MRPGVVTVDSNSFGNDRHALRFSPNGQLLAWNTGGSVVIWDLGATAPGQDVQSDVVLTSSSLFDPTALGISDSGEVATVGLQFYTTPGSIGNDVVLTGDELGRFLQPIGVARIVSDTRGQVAGQVSVAMPDTGQIAAVALDFNGSRIFTDTWGESPADLLSQLCASSSATLTASEWQTYFPGEPYQPACTSGTTGSAWNIDASPASSVPEAVHGNGLELLRGGHASDVLAVEVGSALECAHGGERVGDVHLALRCPRLDACGPGQLATPKRGHPADGIVKCDQGPDVGAHAQSEIHRKPDRGKVE
jgi:hypothetical protein